MVSSAGAAANSGVWTAGGVARDASTRAGSAPTACRSRRDAWRSACIFKQQCSHTERCSQVLLLRLRVVARFFDRAHECNGCLKRCEAALRVTVTVSVARHQSVCCAVEARPSSVKRRLRPPASRASSAAVFLVFSWAQNSRASDLALLAPKNLQ